MPDNQVRLECKCQDEGSLSGRHGTVLDRRGEAQQLVKCMNARTATPASARRRSSLHLFIELLLAGGNTDLSRTASRHNDFTPAFVFEQPRERHIIGHDGVTGN